MSATTAKASASLPSFSFDSTYDWDRPVLLSPPKNGTAFREWLRRLGLSKHYDSLRERGFDRFDALGSDDNDIQSYFETISQNDLDLMFKGLQFAEEEVDAARFAAAALT